MRMRWLTIKSVLLLLCIAGCADASVQGPAESSSPKTSPLLSFEQSIAFSDFDADGLIDQANIANWGLHRSVKVVLSRNSKPRTLHFENGHAGRGSLFAQDVDSDGAADLVWTDLLHAESVVVWLGSNDGEFARVPAALYADGYTLPDQSINAPDETIREIAIGSASRCSSEEPRHSSGYSLLANPLPRHRLQILSTSSPAFGQPTDRGPPYPLS